MKPASPVIPGHNFKETIFAKDQPEYQQLPALVTEDGNYVMTRWTLTWRERWRVLWTGSVWLHVMTFGRKLQPVLLEAVPPEVLDASKNKSEKGAAIFG